MNGTVTKYYGVYPEPSRRAGGQRIAMRTNGTLNYILGDHLGSTSLVTDSAGNVLSQQKYKAWGEERYSSGTKQTSYGFTGQDSDSYINLLDYGSRRYDPELGRFIQPDSIVPLASQGVQAYDRYGYVNNNPVRYNDPTGHEIPNCPTCQFWSSVNIAINNTLGQDATGFWGLALRGILDASHANITGQGREQLKKDPDLIEKQNMIIDKIQNNPKYGLNGFTPSDQHTSVYVGDHGNTLISLTDENFWTVHAGTLSARNINVSEEGVITTTWVIDDKFDFRADWSDHETRTGGTYWKYNILAEVFGDFLYHGVLGATDKMTTTTTWTESVCPDDRTNRSCSR